MEAKSLALLDAVIDGACRALFESVGVPLEASERVSGTRDNVGASIGFTGAVLKGSLVMISTRQLVQEALPAEVGHGDSPEQIADWTGELANQLLGRINNKLLTYGVTLEMSTPSVIFGLELVRRDTRSSFRRELVYRHGDQPLLVSFDVVAPPGFELTIPDEPPAAGISEGEIALF